MPYKFSILQEHNLSPNQLHIIYFNTHLQSHVSFRGISLLRSSSRCLAWPWLSLTDWHCGRGMRWRNRLGYSKCSCFLHAELETTIHDKPKRCYHFLAAHSQADWAADHWVQERRKSRKKQQSNKREKLEVMLDSFLL